MSKRKIELIFSFLSNKMQYLFIGCGAVGHAFIELVSKYKLLEKFSPIIIIEPKDLLIDRYGLLPKGNYIHIKRALTLESMRGVLLPLLRAKRTFIIDVSVNVDAIEIIKIAIETGSMYINTSMESWNNDHGKSPYGESLYKKSLKYRNDCLDDYVKTLKKPFRTVITDHGMNPGLISHFAIQGLMDYAKSRGYEKHWNFAEIAKYYRLKTIHIAEIDSSRTKKLVYKGFVNTWSSEGFEAEALDPVQIGYGTYYRKRHRKIKNSIIAGNMLILNKRGMDLSAMSYIPGKGYYRGLLIPHGEANTLSAYLSTSNYIPTVYYVYKPSDIAYKSLQRVKKRNYKPLAKTYVLKLDDIISGEDAVGAFMTYENGDKWWAGTILSVDDVKEFGLKFSNPTVVQVAISMIAAVDWALQHPYEGWCKPEDLPHRDIIEYCRPFLGRVISMPIYI